MRELSISNLLNDSMVPGAAAAGHSSGMLSTDSLLAGAVLNFREFMSAPASSGGTADHRRFQSQKVMFDIFFNV